MTLPPALAFESWQLGAELEELANDIPGSQSQRGVLRNKPLKRWHSQGTHAYESLSSTGFPEELPGERRKVSLLLKSYDLTCTLGKDPAP